MARIKVKVRVGVRVWYGVWNMGYGQLADAEDAVEALLEDVGELGREQRVALLGRDEVVVVRVTVVVARGGGGGEGGGGDGRWWW